MCILGVGGALIEGLVSGGAGGGGGSSEGRGLEGEGAGGVCRRGWRWEGLVAADHGGATPWRDVGGGGLVGRRGGRRRGMESDGGVVVAVNLVGGWGGAIGSVVSWGERRALEWGDGGLRAEVARGQG